MYDQAMAAAVDMAQKRLMNTAENDSVLMRVSKELEQLRILTDKLDPSKIDFDKGGFERLKANSYWNKFEDSYSGFTAVSESLARDKKILYNSNVTVKRIYSEFCEVYDRFRAVPDENRDEEYIRQAAVTENMAMLLKSSLDEHEAVYNYLGTVLTVLESSLNTAVYLAKVKFGRSIGGRSSAVVTGEVTGAGLRDGLSRLSSLLAEKRV